MPLSTLSAVGAACVGLIAHWGVFIRDEWHLRGPILVLLHLGLVAMSWIVKIMENTDRSYESLLIVLSLFSCYLAGLYGSITVYRLLFHRLRHFPGPRLAALTKCWHVVQCWDSRNHLVLESMNKKYGDFVRTGPEEITIFHPAAFELLDGPKNHNTRADWYDIVHPRISPIFARDEASHLARRRVWNQALSTKSIRQYLPRILAQISNLEGVIESYQAQPCLLNDVMSWFAFDSMGEFVFNQNFGMMKSREWHSAIIQQRAALALLGPLNAMVWLPRLAFAFVPFMWKVRDWFGMIEFCDARMAERLKTKVIEPDVAAWFIEEYYKTQATRSQRKRQNLLSGNAVSVIVGGSDTTGPTLILLWFSLARYPYYAEMIHEEVSSVDIHDPTALSTLPCLNGFIKESMRLFPAALTMGSRVTPPGGLWAEDTFIPGGVKVTAPRYSIFRLESAFEEPLSFKPERWYSRPEMVKDKRAFAPFATGRRMCVGKDLALTQVRLVAAILLKRYRVRFAPGENGEAVERDMRDQVTAQPGKCRVVFEAR